VIRNYQRVQLAKRLGPSVLVTITLPNERCREGEFYAVIGVAEYYILKSRDSSDRPVLLVIAIKY
jgi:hypothetical protein